jgi:hypothetical protein
MGPYKAQGYEILNSEEFTKIKRNTEKDDSATRIKLNDMYELQYLLGCEPNPSEPEPKPSGV